MIIIILINFSIYEVIFLQLHSYYINKIYSNHNIGGNNNNNNNIKNRYSNISDTG